MLIFEQELAEKIFSRPLTESEFQSLCAHQAFELMSELCHEQVGPPYEELGPLFLRHTDSLPSVQGPLKLLKKYCPEQLTLQRITLLLEQPDFAEHLALFFIKLKERGVFLSSEVSNDVLAVLAPSVSDLVITMTHLPQELMAWLEQDIWEQLAQITPDLMPSMLIARLILRVAGGIDTPDNHVLIFMVPNLALLARTLKSLYENRALPWLTSEIFESLLLCDYQEELCQSLTVLSHAPEPLLSAELLSKMLEEKPICQSLAKNLFVLQKTDPHLLTLDNIQRLLSGTTARTILKEYSVAMQEKSRQAHKSGVNDADVIAAIRAHCLYDSDEIWSEITQWAQQFQVFGLNKYQRLLNQIKHRSLIHPHLEISMPEIVTAVWVLTRENSGQMPDVFHNMMTDLVGTFDHQNSRSLWDSAEIFSQAMVVLRELSPLERLNQTLTMRQSPTKPK